MQKVLVSYGPTWIKGVITSESNGMVEIEIGENVRITRKDGDGFFRVAA